MCDFMQNDIKLYVSYIEAYLRSLSVDVSELSFKYAHLYGELRSNYKSNNYGT
jgi:hypothetical protein